jgi:hypothetical protein
MSGMKTNVIKLALNHKIKDWLSTITDESVKKLAEANTLVSGGAIASMLAGDKVNDYDIYFRNQETALAIAYYYVNTFNKTKGELKAKAIASCNPEVKVETRKNIRNEEEARIVIYIKSAGVASESQTTYEYFESSPEISNDEFMSSLSSDEGDETVNEILVTDPYTTAQELSEDLKDKKAKYRPIFFSENAVTLSQKVQLVTRFYGEPDKIHDNYDYAHSMCCYDYAKGNLIIHEEALRSILSRSLIYKGSLYPVASLFRIRKFINRGWRISAGQMLKIIMQLSNVDLKNPAVLKEQLIGVDQAYMHQLIAALQSQDSNRVDTTYLAKLVDEIFE